MMASSGLSAELRAMELEMCREMQHYQGCASMYLKRLMVGLKSVLLT